MGEKEIYLVSTIDGKTHNVKADTIQECVEMFGEDNIWQITKLYYKGE